MGTLIVRVGNALRQPLPDQMDVQVVSARTDRLVRAVTGVPGHAEINVEGLIDHQILGIHHVRPGHPNEFLFDMLFLGSGLMLAVVGFAMVRGARKARVG